MKTDNSIRHWTATVAHIQLVIGIILYTKSPVISYFWKNTKDAIKQTEVTFFSLYHFVGMLMAIVIITIGSALAKRRKNDEEKFKTQLIYFSVALMVILLLIPWPFSPIASRPFIR